MRRADADLPQMVICDTRVIRMMIAINF